MTDAAITPDAVPMAAILPQDAPPRDLLSKFDALIAERQALLDSGVCDPFAIVMDEVRSPTEAMINGRETILLGTYNYMGMTFDPDVIAAGKRALDQFGSGTTGSRVLNGTYSGHKDCEEALKEFYGTSSAMVFSTGYQANLGMISTLAGKGDYVILDADSHASIYDGCWLGAPRSCASATIRWRTSTSGSAGCPRKRASSLCSRASIRCSATWRRFRRWSRSQRSTAR